ncbi:hypothetical protein [Stagnihabitans tardus]|uniref:Uncharacterized protein n=1 Tax=Stagnihabitans tardus TaxID=2699202 RepID=A0AAE4Y7L1_9RHOB|nr:hypothetical protein [Stagnihabitans tardus]NBZ86291.1 hypothetical protein [Stagnihabitans tardus]
MFSIYAMTADCLRKNPVFYAIAAVVLSLPSLLSIKESYYLGPLLIGTFALTQGLLGHMLKQEPLLAGFSKSMRKVILPVLLLVVPPIVLAIGAAMVLAGGTPTEVFLGTLFTAWFAISLLWTALSGMALPAAVAGESFSPGQAFARAGRTALPVLGGLFIGPILSTVVIAVLLITLFFLTGSAAWIDSPVPFFALSIVSNLATLVIFTLGVAVLVRAWSLRIAPPSVAEVF